MQKIIDHYDSAYFDRYQKKIGEFGGIANKFKFEKHIKSQDRVLDFGCGGGFLLNNLNCAHKIGIELNEVARNYCKSLGIECYNDLSQIQNESIDVVISNHCLEHTLNPIEIISELYKKLKPGGQIILVVPLDSYNYKWIPKDVNNHLYSFSPMNLGNILQGAGFREIKTCALLHKWFPFHRKVFNLLGLTVFHYLCWVYGRLNKRWVQVKALATK